jgi:hypothetical protein
MNCCNNHWTIAHHTFPLLVNNVEDDVTSINSDPSVHLALLAFAMPLNCETDVIRFQQPDCVDMFEQVLGDESQTFTVFWCLPTLH